MKERRNNTLFAAFLSSFIALLFMALLTFLPAEQQSETKKQSKSKTKNKHENHQKNKHENHQKNKLHKNHNNNPNKQQSSSSSWDQIKNLLTCKQIETSKIHDPSKTPTQMYYTKLHGSCSSICTFKNVVHGNTRVVHRADNSPDSSSLGQEKRLLSKRSGHGSSSSRSISSVRSSNNSAGNCSSGSYRGMQFRKLSGCYECHSIVDPSRYPLSRTTICACSQCGEVFPKIESLEHHQAIRHAVSELGPEDSSRNIVEIIFKSSWLKKDNPICKIERILKVHNTPRTIQRFEDCRDAVKTRAAANPKKSARCAADGNELLRFYCATLACSLGARGSTSLCASLPGCGICTIIRHGFQSNKVAGIRTTASSGRAHDCLGGMDGRRAMLVCRVIAGRVRRLPEDTAGEEDGGGLLAGGSYDSVGTQSGIYSNLEELHVFNPRAILPCFVVIYKALDS